MQPCNLLIGKTRPPSALEQMRAGSDYLLYGRKKLRKLSNSDGEREGEGFCTDCSRIAADVCNPDTSAHHR